MQETKFGLWLLVVSLMLVGGTRSIASAATVNVASGGDVQAALNGAQCGDTIVLEAGATYSRSSALVLPYKSCTGTDADYITVRTSGTLPPDGVRLDPAQYGSALAKLVALSSSAEAVVMTAPLAHHYKFIGIEFTSDGAQFLPALIRLGDATTYTQRLAMTGFVFDRCFMHPAEISATNLSNPSSVRTSERAIQINVKDGWIVNSYIAGFTGYYPTGGIMASEAILADVGPGPLHIINNYLEAWYSNIFLGGSDQSPVPAHTATVSNAAIIGTATLSTVADLAPNDLIAFKIEDVAPRGRWGVGKVTSISGNVVTYSVQTAASQPFDRAPLEPGQAQWKGDVLHDVEIRGNTMHKRPEWGSYSQTKGWIEFKVGRRVTMEGNLFTSGTPACIAPQTRNETGSSPWAEITDFVFRSNKMVNVRNPAFSMLLDDYSHVSNQSHGFLIENNLMIGAADGSSRIFLTAQPGSDVTFSHNTLLNDRAIGDGDGVTQGLVLKDNIFRNGEYGFACFVGDGSTSTCWPGLAMQTNVIVDNRDPITKSNLGPLQNSYPAGNFFPDSDAQVGFVDAANGNYRLVPTSPYKGMASDGTDPGVDMDALEAALGGASSSPPPTPSPTPTPAPTPTPDTTAPRVAINAPSNGASVVGIVAVSVSATDNVGVTMTKYLVDGAVVAGFSPPLLNLSWSSTTVSNGSHQISVVAYDAAGNSSQSTVQVNVANPDVVPPSVSIVSPAAGSRIGSSTLISVRATDNVAMSSIKILGDLKLLATIACSGASCSGSAVWNTKRLKGVHRITATAADTSNNVATTAISVTR